MRPLPTMAAIAAATALCTALPATATTLGRMELTIGGRHVSYRTTDGAEAGSGWEPREAGRTLSILWKGKKSTDLMLMEMVVKDGRPVSGRIALPEAMRGTLEAKMPRTLRVTLGKAETNGSWLRIEGRLRGTFYPVRRGGRLLPEDGVKVSGSFATWVPGISKPAPKAKTKGKAKAKATAPTQSVHPRPRPEKRG